MICGSLDLDIRPLIRTGKLGAGSFGDIYLAVNIQTGEEVADDRLRESVCIHTPRQYATAEVDCLRARK